MNKSAKFELTNWVAGSLEASFLSGDKLLSWRSLKSKFSDSLPKIQPFSRLSMSSLNSNVLLILLVNGWIGFLLLDDRLLLLDYCFSKTNYWLAISELIESKSPRLNNSSNEIFTLGFEKVHVVLAVAVNGYNRLLPALRGTSSSNAKSHECY